jgi:hypothetical protein
MGVTIRACLVTNAITLNQVGAIVLEHDQNSYAKSM